MIFLYNIGIRLYGLLICVASLFNEKARLLKRGRKDSLGVLPAARRDTRQRLIWFHAASLGEFEQGRPVIERIRQTEPDTKIMLTFFSPSGYEIRKHYPHADYILYLPSDTSRHARQLIEAFKPDAAVFIKYEFWYHYLHELYRRHIPVILISAVFRPGQPFFRKRWGSLHRRMLGFFSSIHVQDLSSVNLLKGVGIRNVRLTGDTRFDRVKQIAGTAKNIEKVERFLNGRPAVVCGSTWPPDEDILTDYINRYTGGSKWIIAPHETGESHIKSIMGKCRKKIVRYSEENTGFAEYDVLLIDCIGLLSSVYRYGEIAYIGGGFGAGIHNTIEAAVYGIPVIFGPRYRKFNEAVSLIRDGGGFCIHNATEARVLLDSLLGNPAIAKAAGAKALKYVDSQTGATDTICKELTSITDYGRHSSHQATI